MSLHFTASDGDVFAERYRAVSSRDRRFDGTFVTAVRTTGIYCRPSCPALTPRAENVVFHRTAAAAEAAGFRACRRCRPDCAPGSPEWDVRADVVARAVRLLRDGVLEREGVGGLAARLGYSARHVTRLITDELGVGPLALARSERARTARTLVETTTMRFADVAFAAGYSSVRQFNDSFRAAYGLTPREVRARARGRPEASAPGTLALRLPVRTPFAARALGDFLVVHAVPGLEAAPAGGLQAGTRSSGAGGDPVFARVLDLPHGHALVRLWLQAEHVDAEVELADSRDLAAAVTRLRRLLDLDADPVAIDAHLGDDPLLRPSVLAEPGLRVPGSVDAYETAMRTVVGQQVSLAGAATVLGRVVAAVGEPVTLPGAAALGLTHAFPRPEALAALDPESLPMPRSRARTVVEIAAAVADGDLELGVGADRRATRAHLLARRGIGPWTADYVLKRGLGDPDVLLETDLVMRRVLQAGGLTRETTARWSPWRSYAGMHLWNLAVGPMSR